MVQFGPMLPTKKGLVWRSPLVNSHQIKTKGFSYFSLITATNIWYLTNYEQIQYPKWISHLLANDENMKLYSPNVYFWVKKINQNHHFGSKLLKNK